MIVRTAAYPRFGLIGNPSDGYFGKTIAGTFSNFKAEIELWESPDLELLPSRRDHSVFRSLSSLHDDVKYHGYYGGFRLLKATCKRFVDYCNERGIELDNRNFTLRYRSNVPNRVGLAGSSAIITACARALMGFYNVQISRHTLANLVLSVENQELLIPAGLQDRVAQAYEGLVYMDFDKALMEERQYGRYIHIDPGPIEEHVYIAYREDLSEGTEVYHNDLRARYRRGDKDVLSAISEWAGYTDAFVSALQAFGKGDHSSWQRLHDLINANFDLRQSLYDVGEGNLQLITTARGVGASAKFAGSGGAIVGLFDDEAMFRSLRDAFTGTNVAVVRPIFV